MRHKHFTNVLCVLFALLMGLTGVCSAEDIKQPADLVAEGYTIVQENGLQGIKSYTGDWLAEPIYANAKYLGNGCFSVETVDRDYGIVTTEGSRKFGYMLRNTTPYALFAMTPDTGNWFLLDRGGSVIYTAPSQNSILPQSARLYQQTEGGRMAKFWYHSYAELFPTSSWAAAEVLSAYNAGLVPDSLQVVSSNAISRLDFCHVIARLIRSYPGRILQQQDMSFLDTNDVDVLLAANLGIVSGYQDGSFRPYRSISRQEAAVVLARTIEWVYHGSQSVELSEVKFSDQSSIAGWAAEAVRAVSAQGVMQGLGARFAPTQPYSTEQAVISAYRIRMFGGRNP